MANPMLPIICNCPRQAIKRTFTIKPLIGNFKEILARDNFPKDRGLRDRNRTVGIYHHECRQNQELGIPSTTSGSQNMLTRYQPAVSLTAENTLLRILLTFTH